MINPLSIGGRYQVRNAETVVEKRRDLVIKNRVLDAHHLHRMIIDLYIGRLPKKSPTLTLRCSILNCVHRSIGYIIGLQQYYVSLICTVPLPLSE